MKKTEEVIKYKQEISSYLKVEFGGENHIETNPSSRLIFHRELQRNRIIELTESILMLIGESQFLAAIIVTRSVLESSCMFNYIINKCESKVILGNIHEVDKIIERSIWGTNLSDEIDDKPIHILDAIRSTNKDNKGMLEWYSLLSDFSHTNWSGSYLSFTNIEKGRVSFLKSGEKLSANLIFEPLISSLALFKSTILRAESLLDLLKEEEKKL